MQQVQVCDLPALSAPSRTSICHHVAKDSSGLYMWSRRPRGGRAMKERMRGGGGGREQHVPDGWSFMFPTNRRNGTITPVSNNEPAWLLTSDRLAPPAIRLDNTRAAQPAPANVTLPLALMRAATAPPSRDPPVTSLNIDACPLPVGVASFFLQRSGASF
jgi:hypothetical protein